MAYGIALRVWGRYACFTRPEMKVERVSYDVMTPSAARGILEAVYWKPAIRWVVERIHVLAPIRFTNIRRNELGVAGDTGVVVPLGQVKRAMSNSELPLEVFIEDARQQRAALVLTNVDLSSNEGQYRADFPMMLPPYRAECLRFRRTRSWVFSLVCPM